jgi:hypothetical protein
MRDGRSAAYLAGPQTRAMRGVHPSLNDVATAVVVIGIVVRIVSVVVPVAVRPVAVVVVPVVVAMKSPNDGTGAKAMEAAIVGSSNDGAGTKTVESSSGSATVEAAAAKAAHAASVEATATTKAATTKAAAAKAAAPVSAATSSAASTAACLCTRREQGAGKEGSCQYRHRFSSNHESFLSTGRAISDHRTSRPGPHVVVWLRIANGKFRRQ